MFFEAFIFMPFKALIFKAYLARLTTRHLWTALDLE